ncbi:CHAT domain-containing protein [Dyadobacter sp. CY343]|uniref:CHAT domain-containing protein n=1 Tax=Dyadobacter sp. CY343 TaxID=2907299 RepID=UPI001F4768F6|nr:CHAT domain-containing protein [Dyadobacter sp. CY343]MCE7062555.1 CHAT domain-containing protein [Dyadobacter sp. CY343]
MALIDTYHSNAQRKSDEVARLQQERAREVKKIAELLGKINTSSQALARASSPSTVRSRMNEIARFRNDHASTEKKLSGIDSKLTQKQKELSGEQRKIHKEEESIQKKTARTNQDQINKMNAALAKHDRLHSTVSSRLDQLERLPQSVTVLFLASNPVDQQQLRLDEEAREINEMIKKARHRDSVKLETRWAIRTGDILQAINELDPTIIHFSGHGSNSDQIVVLNPDGTAKFVSKEAIVQVIVTSSDKVRLVFFNTCYSFTQAEAVSQYVDAAIGMSTSIGDDAARIFASQFYSSIGFGLSVKRAFDQARAALMLEEIGEEDTPELFVKEGLNADQIFLVEPELNPNS